MSETTQQAPASDARSEHTIDVAQGTPLHALITSGHHIEVAIGHLRDALAEQDRIVMLLDDTDAPDPSPHEIAEMQLCLGEASEAAGYAVYEWDKRARRSGVDWWNRPTTVIGAGEEAVHA